MGHLFFNAEHESVEDRVTAASLPAITKDDWTNIIRHDFRKAANTCNLQNVSLGFEHDAVSGSA